MSHEVFSPAWAEVFREQINRNDEHRRAAAGWEHPVSLVLEPVAGIPDGRRLLLDLWHGECRSARVVDAATAATADYVLSASLDHWRQIFLGTSDPILALMQGRVKLQKGGMFALARSAGAAKQLVLSARRVPTHFPDETVPAVSAPLPVASTPGPVAVNTTRTSFRSLEARGFDRSSFPYRLFQRAKRDGVWNPSDIDFTRDRADWQRLEPRQQDLVLRLTSLFQGGEESVTEDILPLLLAISREGRLEEEMYLTTFLFEEAKHMEFFRRFLDEVVGAENLGDLSRFESAPYRRIICEELPGAMRALLHDPSPAAQLRASATYNLVVEGTLAETGYRGYYAMLESADLLPGLRAGIGLLKRDESRHIAYGVYLLERLVAADHALWPELESRMGDLLEPALGVVRSLFDPYGDRMPFPLDQDEFIGFALSQFKSRMARIERASRLAPHELSGPGEDEA
ncbi:MAG: R2-like ligand-binding oxidase [Verrucomicrobia bacterium]|nr:R2-like ligand-binding oxidase [Verrucomicrobiota bacterium]